jgi:hypothetical protein
MDRATDERATTVLEETAEPEYDVGRPTVDTLEVIRGREADLPLAIANGCRCRRTQTPRRRPRGSRRNVPSRRRGAGRWPRQERLGQLRPPPLPSASSERGPLPAPRGPGEGDDDSRRESVRDFGQAVVPDCVAGDVSEGFRLIAECEDKSNHRAAVAVRRPVPRGRRRHAKMPSIPRGNVAGRPWRETDGPMSVRRMPGPPESLPLTRSPAPASIESGPQRRGSTWSGSRRTSGTRTPGCLT